MLGFNITATGFYSIELVSAEPPKHYFLPTSFDIEKPFSLRLHNRNRKLPVVIANGQKRPARKFFIRCCFHFLARKSGKLRCKFTILSRFTGMNDVVTVGSQYFLQSRLVKFFKG